MEKFNGLKVVSKSKEETEGIASVFAKTMKSGDIVLLSGDLGAGKTVFAKGFVLGMGIDTEVVSPTFTIMNEYGGGAVYHFDLYRLDDPFELYEIGFEEYVYSDGISCIEWASKCGDLLPDESIKINISIEDEKRKITVIWKD